MSSYQGYADYLHYLASIFVQAVAKVRFFYLFLGLFFYFFYFKVNLFLVVYISMTMHTRNHIFYKCDP